MTTKKNVRIATLTCKPTDHSFCHVEITPSPFPAPGGLGPGWQVQANQVRIFKLYCHKCGQVRSL